MPPLSTEDAIKLIRRRNHEWQEFQKHWRFLADSYEGGQRYKMADYSLPCDGPASSQQPIVGQGHGSGFSVGGFDVATGLPNMLAYGRISDRNLTPHLSETDPSNSEIYALRLARTPIPKRLEKVVRRHLARIYAREVQREGPKELLDWWQDVDCCGVPIDKWMRKTVAPLLCVLGQIDLCFDRPAVDPGVKVETRADLKQHGLDRCVASYILPENMLDWELDRRKRYVWCLVLERHHGNVHFRHWTPEDSVLYAANGEVVEIDGVPQVIPHSYGCVPIVRVFDERKARCDNVGQPRYETVADYQKCIYNALSEQILADIQQADPILQGPEDYLQAENSVTVGPTGILPMKKRSNGDGYDGWEYVAPDQDQSKERRVHILDYGDEIDSSAALVKPAGASGTGTNTVAQSGVSKSFDSQEGNDYLSEVAATLEDAEITAAEFVMLVLGDGNIPPGLGRSLVITYPREFDLVSGDDLAGNLTDMHGLAGGAGVMPETSKEYMKRKLRVDMPGMDEARRIELEAEIDAICDRSEGERQMAGEGIYSDAGGNDPTSLPDAYNNVLGGLNASSN